MKPLTAYQLAVSGDDTETVCSRLRADIREAYTADRDLTIAHADLQTLLFLVDEADTKAQDRRCNLIDINSTIGDIKCSLENLESLIAELT